MGTLPIIVSPEQFQDIEGRKEEYLKADIGSVQKLFIWNKISDSPYDFLEKVRSGSSIPWNHLRQYTSVIFLVENEDIRFLEVELKGISYRTGDEKLGAIKGVKYFVLELGHRIENIKVA